MTQVCVHRGILQFFEFFLAQHLIFDMVANTLFLQLKRIDFVSFRTIKMF